MELEGRLLFIIIRVNYIQACILLMIKFQKRKEGTKRVSLVEVPPNLTLINKNLIYFRLLIHSLLRVQIMPYCFFFRDQTLHWSNRWSERNCIGGPFKGMNRVFHSPWTGSFFPHRRPGRDLAVYRLVSICKFNQNFNLMGPYSTKS
jgi:hypothetical protein